MKIIDTVFKPIRALDCGIISIGFFDSMHLGHKKILNALTTIAKEKRLKSFVLTYDSLPVKENKKKILILKEKLDYLAEIGIDNIILSHFDDAFRNLSPTEFIRLLNDNFNITEYVVESNFKFGSNRNGNRETLLKNNCTTHIIEPYFLDQTKISTSLIKKQISQGRVENARQLLGRPFSINGIVKKGKQLGRILGFPTMNISNPALIYPADGVYCSNTHIQNEKYNSMTYVNSDIIETNLIDYNKFEYNFEIKVDFLKKIRDNQLFSNLENLKEQLFLDLETTKNYFGIK